MAEVIKMPGTVRSVNGIKPDENANVTLPSILEAYPVGSIYLSIKPTNPGTLFGGTWVHFAQGRMLIGIGTATNPTTGDDYTIQSGETGGAKSVALTWNNIPKHTHSITVGNNTKEHRHNNGVFDEVPEGQGPLATNTGSIKLRPIKSQHVLAADNTAYGTSTELYMGQTSLTKLTHNHTATASAVGADNAAQVNIMPPYIGVYMWERTA